jgi:hypothetical protein
MVTDECAVVVQKRGNVREKVLWPINAVRGLVAVKVIAEAHLERLHEHLHGEEDGRELDLVAWPAGIAHALQFGQLQIEQLHDGRVPFLLQLAGYGGLGRGPVYLLEGAVEVGGEGVKDLGAQGASDGVDVVEQLGSGALCVVVQVDEAGVECAQLLVGLEGGFIGRVELRLGLFAARHQLTGAVSDTMAVLPEHIDFSQQLHVSVGDVEAVQRVEDVFKAWDGLVARVRGGDDHQTAVDVGLLVVEAVGAAGEVAMVRVRRLLGRVQVALGIVELLAEEALRRGEGGQQGVEAIEIRGILQLVVEEVGDASLVVVEIHGVGCPRGGRSWVCRYAVPVATSRASVVGAAAPTILVVRHRSIIPAILRSKIQPCVRPLLENILTPSTAVSHAPVNFCTAVSKA